MPDEKALVSGACLASRRIKKAGVPAKSSRRESPINRTTRPIKGANPQFRVDDHYHREERGQNPSGPAARPREKRKLSHFGELIDKLGQRGASPMEMHQVRYFLAVA